MDTASTLPLPSSRPGRSASSLGRSRIRGAFTLVELLVVISIIGILIALVLPGLQALNHSGNFNKSVAQVSGLLEQSRAYAIAQDTYVWVVFYENAPAGGGPLDIYAGSYASNDGTDPFVWTGTAALPSTVLTPINSLYHFSGLHLQTATLPNAPANPGYPANTPVFQCTPPGTSVTLPSNPGSGYWVIQFTPSGAARNSSSPIASIWLGMEPSNSPTSFDTHNVASLMVNGFTGLTTVYRQ